MRSRRPPSRRRPRPRRSRRRTSLRAPDRQPERTCAGCGRKAPQVELVRYGAIDGRLAQGRAVPGRGVYTCRRLACFERARAGRGFNRVLRQTVAVDPDLSRYYTGT